MGIQTGVASVTSMQVTQNIKVEVPFDPAIMLLGIYIYMHTYMERQREREKIELLQLFIDLNHRAW